MELEQLSVQGPKICFVRLRKCAFPVSGGAILPEARGACPSNFADLFVINVNFPKGVKIHHSKEPEDVKLARGKITRGRLAREEFRHLLRVDHICPPLLPYYSVLDLNHTLQQNF